MERGRSRFTRLNAISRSLPFFFLSLFSFSYNQKNFVLLCIGIAFSAFEVFSLKVFHFFFLNKIKDLDSLELAIEEWN